MNYMHVVIMLMCLYKVVGLMVMYMHSYARYCLLVIMCHNMLDGWEEILGTIKQNLKIVDPIGIEMSWVIDLCKFGNVAR